MATRGRTSLEPPQARYWRRRANRRVRKARRVRTALRWAVIVLVNAVLLGVLALAGYRGMRELTSSSRFTLDEILIEGVERSSAERLRGLLAPFVGRNLLEVDLEHVAELAVGDPWVRGASAKRVLPGTLRVRVHERVPAAVALIGGVAHVVDTEGFVIGPSGSFPADDLPVITGLDGLEGRKLAAALSRGVGALQRLGSASPSWAAGISELDLSQADGIRVRMANPGPTLLLDPETVERNVNEYLALREQIDRRVGPATYVDLRWSDRISVMPGEEISSVENR